MLQKTLKFDDTVLDILRGMEWSQNGTIGKMTCGQLDRKMYEAVNKALETMGGKWNRKAGGHVFPSDPRPMVDGLLESGSLTVERDGFFETPRTVVSRMLELLPLPERDRMILEPSAGMGAIVKALIANGARPNQIWCVEKNGDRALKLRDYVGDVFRCDFLLWNERKFQRVYMNPPFEEGQDIDHVRHAYDLLDENGSMVSVMSEGPFFRGDKKATAFRDWLDEVHAYSEPLPEGSFRDSGTGVNARLVVIER